MSFTTPCFIRKNTSELKTKLEELGYKSSIIIFDDNKLCIATAVNKEYAKYTNITNEMFDSINPHTTWNCAGRINCGTNENLFLAIASLRDDTDKFQWFTDGSNDFWLKCGDNSILDSFEYYRNKYNKEIHKASVNELIEHFNEKGD